MKKLLIIVTILTGTICSTARPSLGALLTTGIGAGTTGVSYLLYQETQRNSCLGEVGKLSRMIATEAGFGSSIQNLRFNIQKFISQNIYSIDQKKFFEVEELTYASFGILGAIITLYGLKNFFTK